MELRHGPDHDGHGKQEEGAGLQTGARRGALRHAGRLELTHAGRLELRHAGRLPQITGAEERDLRLL